jgi:hypothetical protein
VSHEDQLHAGAPIKRFGQAEEATSKRNDLQFASTATTVLRSKDGGSEARKPSARTAVSRVRVRDVGHVSEPSVVCGLQQQKDYGRTYRAEISRQDFSLERRSTPLVAPNGDREVAVKFSRRTNGIAKHARRHAWPEPRKLAAQAMCHPDRFAYAHGLCRKCVDSIRWGGKLKNLPSTLSTEMRRMAEEAAGKVPRYRRNPKCAEHFRTSRESVSNFVAGVAVKNALDMQRTVQELPRAPFCTGPDYR